MINFDAVDFSERRSEEVISFFWRSVYFVIYTKTTTSYFITHKQEIIKNILQSLLGTSMYCYSTLPHFKGSQSWSQSVMITSAWNGSRISMDTFS